MRPILAAKYSASISTSGKTPHHHDCHQLLYVLEGSLEVVIDGKHYLAESGSLIIISRLEMHSITIKSNTYKRYEIRINPEYTSNRNTRELHSVFVNRPEGFSHVLYTQNTGIKNIISNITTEHNNPTILSEEMQSLLLEELVISLYRSNPNAFGPNDRKTEIVDDICKKIENNLNAKFTLSELANSAHLNEYYLSHIFKSVTGYSIMGYLMSLRIATAKRLLTKTEMSISEIIEYCGFSDGSNFSRTFRKTTGVSPSEFRKNFKK